MAPERRGAREQGPRGGRREPRWSPIYERLPHGPHGMGREEVRLNQRNRLQGGLVLALAESGFQGATVGQVVALAGVSRRSFYELYRDKLDCLLQTYESLAARELLALQRRCAQAAPPHRRLELAFAACEQAFSERPEVARLLLTEVQSAGPPAQERLRAATVAASRLLAAAMSQGTARRPPPAPVLLALAGGLHGLLAAALETSPLPRRGELAHQLTAQAVAVAELPEALLEELRRRLRHNLGEPAEPEAGARQQFPPSDRDRLLTAALELVAQREPSGISAPQIADRARLGIDQFFASFSGREACLWAAFERCEERLMAALDVPIDRHRTWPGRVRLRVGALLGHLGSSPLEAGAIVTGACLVGPAYTAWSRALSLRCAEVIMGGGPCPLEGPALEAAAGAVWHTIRCQLAAGAPEKLPALADQLACVLLAPVVGARATAAELLGQAPA